MTKNLHLFSSDSQSLGPRIQQSFDCFLQKITITYYSIQILLAQKINILNHKYIKIFLIIFDTNFTIYRLSPQKMKTLRLIHCITLSQFRSYRIEQNALNLNYKTLIMRLNQKAKTSVFSQYENNQNDSISSRQLQYWLKQTAPIVQPKFSGIQWTLMSTNSIFQQEEHTLQRTQTFQSINKENDYLSFNSARPILNNNSSITKSKSYVNAMVDLQNKIKHLQSENQSLKQALNSLKDQRTRVINESVHIAQEMKNRLDVLEPKARRIQQLTKQNKRLRDLREQNNKKTKILQKINKENQMKLTDYQKNVHNLQQNLKQKQKYISELELKSLQQTTFAEKNKEMMYKIQEKNKILQEMKEKSTTSIIQKYNKSVEMVQALTTQNMKLKQQNMLLKEKYQQRLRQIEQRYRVEKQEWMKLTQQLKLETVQKKQIINNLSNDTIYFKENYQKKNQQLIKTLREHAIQIRHIKEAHQKEAVTWREKAILYFQKKTEKKESMIEINKESMIRIKEQQPKYQVESQLQFQELNSIQQTAEVQENTRHQTRSLDKKSHKHSNAKSIVSKPVDCLSQKESKNISAQSKSKQKMNSAIQGSNGRRKSQEKITQKSRQKDKSKSRQIAEGTINENDHSFILKSCQPITLTHKQDRAQEFIYSRQPYYYNSANNQPSKNHIPYYWEPNEIPQFGISQRGNVNNNEYSVQKALLVQANRQAIRLIQEQQKCINLLNENVSQTERAQNLGRMKQISEQIKLNNQRMLQLKIKIAGQAKQ